MLRLIKKSSSTLLIQPAFPQGLIVALVANTWNDYTTSAVIDQLYVQCVCVCVVLQLFNLNRNFCLKFIMPKISLVSVFREPVFVCLFIKTSSNLNGINMKIIRTL